MAWNTTSEGATFTLLALLTLCVSCQVPQEPRESLKTTPGWPPRVIYNTDGNWVFNYLPKRNTGDLTAILDALQDTAVDIVSVLIGIDDDLSWRGSDHGQLWGDNTEDWNPDGKESNDSVGGMDMSDVERLHRNMAAIIEDGHDLLKIYIDRARDLKLGIFASFRMNDGHTSYEDRGWYGRSALKLKRTDLLLGSPAAYRSAARADEWGFSWQWDYAKAEVRERFLGLFDEVLSRYDFDGLELDFSRQPPFFRSGQGHKHATTMTDFIRKAREIVKRHQPSKGRELRLIVRVPPSIDHTLELGLDTVTWIREGLVDAVVLGAVCNLSQQIDVAPAVEAARNSGVLVYPGFDTRTHRASPQNGAERSPVTLLRGTTLNGYKQS